MRFYAKLSALALAVLLAGLCPAFAQDEQKRDEGQNRDQYLTRSQAQSGKKFENNFLPGFQGGIYYLFPGQTLYYGGELRFDLVYALNRSNKQAAIAERGRSEGFMAIGLYYSPRPDADFMFTYLCGYNISFETPAALERDFLIPYIGFALGGITIKDRGTGFAACPVLGLNIVSLPKFTLSLESSLLLSTVAFEEFLALRASLFLAFVF